MGNASRPTQTGYATLGQKLGRAAAIGFAVAIAVIGLTNAVLLLVWSAVREEVVWRGNGLASVVSITAHLGMNPARSYTGGERGWIGDSPFIFLDTAKIRSLGWTPRLSIRDGIIKTLDYLQANPWLMDERS